MTVGVSRREGRVEMLVFVRDEDLVSFEGSARTRDLVLAMVDLEISPSRCLRRSSHSGSESTRSSSALMPVVALCFCNCFTMV